jgi:hypothetical protein
MTSFVHPELSLIRVTGTTRAAFLTRATLAAGALAGLGALPPFVSGALAQGGGDVDILNFALTLEHLEAAFYEQAVAAVPGLSDDVRTLARELARNEAEHVKALREAVRSLDGTPAERPGVDFGGAFAGQESFLRVANVLEDTGVSAYNGAGPMLESKELLAAAGSILQVEARHAALIRLERDRPPAPLAFDKASSKRAVLKAVEPFLTG